MQAQAIFEAVVKARIKNQVHYMVGTLIEIPRAALTVDKVAGEAEFFSGLCGEHGGEPSSVEFCHRVGMDYVSCSPYRVPIALLATAQAAITSQDAGGKAEAARTA
jgi:phosphoenolpyruvate synthase/pyruvate phosphate dikinase